jgi:hypothetical protein
VGAEGLPLPGAIPRTKAQRTALRPGNEQTNLIQ